MHSDIEDFTTDQLASEISRRCYQYAQGNCPYCKCKMMDMGGKKACSCKHGNDLDKWHTQNVLQRFQYGDRP
jgi:hypothetical protein